MAAFFFFLKKKQHSPFPLFFFFFLESCCFHLFKLALFRLSLVALLDGGISFHIFFSNPNRIFMIQVRAFDRLLEKSGGSGIFCSR